MCFYLPLKPLLCVVQMISVEALEWEQTRKKYCELIAKLQQLLTEANSTRAATENVRVLCYDVV